MNEFIGGITILWCATTYWLGGQEIPGLKKGFKWIRRFCLPLGLFVLLIIVSTLPVWKLLLASIFLCVALHLGYQAKLWKYAIVGLLFAAPSLILTSPNWTMLLPLSFHTLFGFASLRDNRFGWSFVAILTGASIGITYIASVQ